MPKLAFAEGGSTDQTPDPSFWDRMLNRPPTQAQAQKAWFNALDRSTPTVGRMKLSDQKGPYGPYMEPDPPADWKRLNDPTRTAAFNPLYDRNDPNRMVDIDPATGRVNISGPTQPGGQGPEYIPPAVQPSRPATKISSAGKVTDMVNKMIGPPPTDMPPGFDPAQWGPGPQGPNVGPFPPRPELPYGPMPPPSPSSLAGGMAGPAAPNLGSPPGQPPPIQAGSGVGRALIGPGGMQAADWLSSHWPAARDWFGRQLQGPHGGQTYGGQRYGGQRYGGNTYGGARFGASAGPGGESTNITLPQFQLPGGVQRWGDRFLHTGQIYARGGPVGYAGGGSAYEQAQGQQGEQPPDPSQGEGTGYFMPSVVPRYPRGGGSIAIAPAAQLPSMAGSSGSGASNEPDWAAMAKSFSDMAKGQSSGKTTPSTGGTGSTVTAAAPQSYGSLSDIPSAAPGFDAMGSPLDLSGSGITYAGGGPVGMAGGGGLGSILGTLGGLAGNLIPIPIIGPMIGKMAGNTLGDLIGGTPQNIGTDVASDVPFIGSTLASSLGRARGGPLRFMRGGYPELYNAPVRHAFARSGFVPSDGQGNGRSDHIDAALSPGEFVMDAETTSMLGDGDNTAGARKLEGLRQNIRRHKGAQLARGKFSPKAKQPEAYMSPKLSAADRMAHSGVSDGLRARR